MKGSDLFSRPVAQHILCAVLPPVFFIVFALLYNPCDIKGDYSFGNLGYGFHLVMLTCIALLSFAVCRAAYALATRHHSPTARQHAIYFAAAAFVSACFWALYTAIFVHGDYFSSLSDCLWYAILIFVFPSLFLIAKFAAQPKRDAEEDNLVKFYDEHHRLKLTLEASSLLYIAAEFNYIKIHYTLGGAEKEYMLRNSMKSQQETAEACSLVRCHRSYYVNPAHVKVLRKDKEGAIVAVLDLEGAISVPVSKQYYDSLASML